MKKRTKNKPDGLTQIAKYIESNGWKIVVIGPARIQQPFGGLGFNYELVVGFTGVKRQDSQKKATHRLKG